MGSVRHTAAFALALTFAPSIAHAGDADAPLLPIVPPPAESNLLAAPQPLPACCQVALDVSPRLGVSVNGDQWLFGGQLRTSLPCLGSLGFGPLLAFGLGGNYLSVRSSGRLDYMIWLDRGHVLGFYPAVGASVNFYMPVGHFASFCHRVDLDECSGYNIGGELGGGVRYRRFGIDAIAGFGGLPALTIMAAMAFPLARPEGP